MPGIVITFSLKGLDVVKKGFDSLRKKIKELKKDTFKLSAALISVMFFGMKLQKTFGGLWKSLKRFNVEIAFSVIRMSLFAAVLGSPRFQAFNKIMFSIMKWFLKLPTPVRELLGGLQVFTGFLGSALETGGSIALFLLALEKLDISLTGLSGIATGAGIGISVFALAWITDFNDIQETTENVVDGVKDTLGGLVTFIDGILSEDKFKITSGFKDIFLGVAKGIVNIVEFTTKTMADLILLPLDMLGKLARLVGKVTGIKIFKDIGETLAKPGEFIEKQIENFTDKINEHIDKAFEPTKTSQQIIEAVVGGREAERTGRFISPNLSPAAMKAFGLNSFQTGGFVNKDQLAFLHKGETVVPKSGGGGGLVYSPTINIQASISNDFDIDNLVNIINEKLNTNLVSQVM